MRVATRPTVERQVGLAATTGLPAAFFIGLVVLRFIAPAVPAILLVILVSVTLVTLTRMVRFELALYGILWFVACEALVRTYLSFHPLSFLLRDAMLVVLYFRYMHDPSLRGRNKGRRFPLRAVIVAYVGLNLLQILNPNLPLIWIGFGGAKQRVITIPLYFIAFQFFNNKERIQRLMRVLVMMGVVLSAIGLMQVALGPERSATLGFPIYSEGSALAWQSQFVAKAFVYKPVATTTGIASMGEYLLVALVILAGRGLGGRKKGRLLPTVGASVLVGLVLLLLFSRGFWIMGALGVGVVMLLRRAWLAPVPAIASMLVAVSLAGQLSGGFIEERFDEVRDPIAAFQEERAGEFFIVFDYMKRYPYGMGLQGASGGSNFYTEWTPNYRPLSSHNYFATLVGETSIVGGLLFFLIVLGFLAFAVRALFAVRDREVKVIAAILAAYFLAEFIGFFVGTGPDAAPLNFHFWILGGIAARLMPLRRAGDSRKVLGVHELDQTAEVQGVVRRSGC